MKQAMNESAVSGPASGVHTALLLGTPRSGTTLVSALLAGAPESLSLSEPYLAHGILPDWKLHRFLMRCQREARMRRIRPPFRGDAAAFGAFLTRLAAANGCRRLLIKETFRDAPPHPAWQNAELLDALVQRIPSAALLRDPFDTAASTVNLCKPVLGAVGMLLRWRWRALPKFRDADAVVAWSARNWVRFVEWVRGRGLPLVRYEDVVAAPHEALSRICAALHVPFDAAMLDSGCRRGPFWGLGDPQTMKTPLRGVHGSAVGRGGQLTPRQRALVREVCGPMAAEFGYSAG